MAAVADTELALYTLGFHLAVEVFVELQKEVVVAAIDKPFDVAQLIQSGLGSVVQKVESRMIAYRLANYFELVPAFVGAADLVVLIVQPGAHCIAGREHIGNRQEKLYNLWRLFER